MSRSQKIIKRIFDIILSVILLIIFSLPIVLLIIGSIIDTKSFGLFFQKRVGYNAELFWIIKVKTFKVNNKVSNFGKTLRKLKLDELPQLFNILRGDMSFVGPRPDLIDFINELKGEDKVILTVKPGLTGPSSLKYFNEEILLIESKSPTKLIKTLWKDKVKINKDYIFNYNFYKDIYYIYKTVLYVIKNIKTEYF